MLLGEPQLRRQVLADQVAVEQSHRAAAHLVELGDEGVGDGRLAGPRQAREQDRESLPAPGWVAATQLGRHFREGEPLGDLAALGQALAQLGARDGEGPLPLRHLVFG